MAWECPECTARNEDGVMCEQCGYRISGAIRLTSAAGKTFETRISFKLDRRIYKTIGSDYQYLQTDPGSYQFEVIKDENSDSGWFLQTSPESNLNTLINDSVCEIGMLYSLYSGDVVKIGSKVNPGAVAAPLTVSFDGE